VGIWKLTARRNLSEPSPEQAAGTLAAMRGQYSADNKVKKK